MAETFTNQTGPPIRRALQWDQDIWNDFLPKIDDLQRKKGNCRRVEKALRLNKKACNLRPNPFHPNGKQISKYLRIWRGRSRQRASQSTSRGEDWSLSEEIRDIAASDPEPELELETRSSRLRAASTSLTAEHGQAKSPITSDIGIANAKLFHQFDKTYQSPVATEPGYGQSKGLADGLASSRSIRSESPVSSLEISSTSAHTFENDTKEAISDIMRLENARIRKLDREKAPSRSTGSVLESMAAPEIRQGITLDSQQLIVKHTAFGRTSSLSSDSRDFREVSHTAEYGVRISDVAHGFLRCLPHMPGNCLGYIEDRPQLLQEDHLIFLKAAEGVVVKGGSSDLLAKCIKCYHYLQKHADLTQTAFREWMGNLEAFYGIELPTAEQLRVGAEFINECDATIGRIREGVRGSARFTE